MRCSVLFGAFTVLLRVGDDLPTFRRPHLKTVCVRQSANANIIAIYSTKAVIDEKKASLRKMRLCVSVPYSKSFDFPIGVLKASIGGGYASAPGRLVRLSMNNINKRCHIWSF